MILGVHRGDLLPSVDPLARLPLTYKILFYHYSVLIVILVSTVRRAFIVTSLLLFVHCALTTDDIHLRLRHFLLRAFDDEPFISL